MRINPDINVNIYFIFLFSQLDKLIWDHQQKKEEAERYMKELKTKNVEVHLFTQIIVLSSTCDIDLLLKPRLFN